MVSMVKSGVTHAATHSACVHPDYTAHGWPVYCPQCADPITVYMLAGEVMVKVAGKVTSHRSALVSA